MDGSSATVLHVAAGSPAQAAGLKTGDVIVAVNGAKPNDPAVNGWRSRAAGTRTALRLSDGRTVDPVLRDYF